MPKKTTGKRERVDTGSDKRYVRRKSSGQFREVEDVGRSSGQDQQRKASQESKPGYGDRGDRRKG